MNEPEYMVGGLAVWRAEADGVWALRTLGGEWLLATAKKVPTVTGAMWWRVKTTKDAEDALNVVFETEPQEDFRCVDHLFELALKDAASRKASTEWRWFRNAVFGRDAGSWCGVIGGLVRAEVTDKGVDGCTYVLTATADPQRVASVGTHKGPAPTLEAAKATVETLWSLVVEGGA